MAAKTGSTGAAPRSNGGGARPKQPSNGTKTSLDELLADATQGPLRRWFPGRALVTSGVRLALRPQALAKRTLGLGAEYLKIAAGRSGLEPQPKGDRRFKDDAWQGNPAFRRLAQGYLATGAAVDGLIDDLELDWRAERRLRFAVENVLDAAAPTNFPQLNPLVLKATLDNGGLNLIKGSVQLARDMRRPPRLPSMVDESAFKVGKNLAVTPGAVVLRTDVFELIQYEPQTAKVREVPLLAVPPMINKYYVADLAKDRSMVQHLVESGQQVFMVSWRNPGKEQADWSLDTYAEAVLEALGAVEAISRQKQTQAMGLCAGGILLSALAAYLADQGESERLAGLTLGVCALDNSRAGTAGAFIDPATATAAAAESGRRGLMDGRALAGVFAWLRPNDLVWSYWVNNYLLGKQPPAFDVLYWNADTTNMPAGLHRDFVKLAVENSLTEPGATTLLGRPVDISKVKTDAYVVAGIADHIVPWESAYRTTHLLGSEPRFVLSTSGHIAAMVNPPGNEKASFRTNDKNPERSDQWLKAATEQRGSWWEDWAAWLGERSGDQRNKPRKLGKKGYEPLQKAPGRYVMQEA